jgi:hypothetical protein
MGSRERKRTERRKRKRRSSSQPHPGPATHDAADAGGAAGTAGIEDLAAEAETRGVSRSELKNQLAREQLEPLAEGERPLVVTLGAVLSAAIAAVTVGAWVVGAEVSGERPNAIQVFAPAILFGVMAWGMWNARYWAVLGFQAVMAILMVGAFLTLISATSVAGALTPVAVLIVAGAFFWFTVKGLARIQMPDRHLPK